MNILNNLSKAYKYYNKISLKILIIYFIILFIAVSIIILKAYHDIPDFMYSIKDQMLENKSFIDSIGNNNGYAVWFDKDKAEKRDTIPFSISITGNDSMFVKIIGKYFYQDNGNIIYIKQDTLYRSYKSI
ncbi:hypothetical protein ACW9KT_09430 [Hymenobacter sp. HD11105]